MNEPTPEQTIREALDFPWPERASAALDELVRQRDQRLTEDESRTLAFKVDDARAEAARLREALTAVTDIAFSYMALAQALAPFADTADKETT